MNPSSNPHAIDGRHGLHILGAGLLSWAMAATALAQSALAEAPSRVQAAYVQPSATRALQPGEKVGGLFMRNGTQDFVLQRVTQRTYWFQRQHYGTIFYVGDQGVLLFDPLDGRAEHIREANLEQLSALDWVWLSGGQGNIGSRADIAFYRQFLADLKQAVGKALGEVAWGTGVEVSTLNAHTAFLPAWLGAVSRSATDQLQPQYGRHYGVETAVPRNAEMVALTLFSYH